METIGITESAIEHDCKNIAYLLKKDSATDCAYKNDGDIDDPNCFAVRTSNGGEQDRCSDEDSPAHQYRRTALRQANPQELNKCEDIEQKPGFTIFVSKIKRGRKEHGEHPTHIIAHSPTCDHEIFVDVPFA